MEAVVHEVKGEALHRFQEVHVMGGCPFSKQAHRMCPRAIICQDSSRMRSCLSPLQAGQKHFDEKLWNGKNDTKFDNQQSCVLFVSCPGSVRQ